jgi:hypothetical protein
MEDENINMVNTFLNYDHNPSLQVAIDEREDVNKYTPNGTTIAYIKSNFTSIFHENYLHLTSDAKKIAKESLRKTNKGRKPKAIEPKNIRFNNGKNNEFSSAITFGIIDPNDCNHVYDAKVFRKKSINISGFKTCNVDYMHMIVDILLDYINSIDPNLQIRRSNNIKINLCNANYVFPLPESDNCNQPYSYNLYRIRIIHRENYKEEFWECEKMIIDSYLYPYYKFCIKYPSGIYVVKFQPNGRLNICGGKNNITNNLIISKFKILIEQNFDYVCHKSIPTRMKKEIC